MLCIQDTAMFSGFADLPDDKAKLQIPILSKTAPHKLRYAQEKQTNQRPHFVMLVEIALTLIDH